MSAQTRVILEGDYTAKEVVGVRGSKRGRELLVRWDGYNCLGDTWEPEEHVQPRSKVLKFDAGIPLKVDLRWYVAQFRNSIAMHMTSRKIVACSARRAWRASR